MKLLLLFLTIVGIFAGKRFHWEEVDIKLEVLSSGNMSVIERQTLVFQDKFQFGYRMIPSGTKGRNDGIYSTKFSEIINETSSKSYSLERSRKNHTYTHRKKNKVSTIIWYFPSTSGKRVYDLSYQVISPLKILEPNVYQLYWILIPEDHQARIERSKVQLLLPSMSEIQGITIYQDNEIKYPEIDQFENKIKFELVNIGYQEQVEVKVVFKFFLDMTLSEWQKSEEFNSTLAKIIVSLFIIALPIIYIYAPASSGGESSDNSDSLSSSSSDSSSGGSMGFG